MNLGSKPKNQKKINTFTNLIYSYILFYTSIWYYKKKLMKNKS